MNIIDPGVHAALVIVIAWLLRMGALALGIDLGEDVYFALAGTIVTYILSLLGWAIYLRIRGVNNSLLSPSGYKPPFT